MVKSDPEKKVALDSVVKSSDQLRHDEAMKGLITVEGKEDVGYVSGVPEEHIKVENYIYLITRPHAEGSRLEF